MNYIAVDLQHSPGHQKKLQIRKVENQGHSSQGNLSFLFHCGRKRKRRML